MASASEEFRARFGALPETLPNERQDPWGNPYVYVPWSDLVLAIDILDDFSNDDGGKKKKKAKKKKDKGGKKKKKKKKGKDDDPDPAPAESRA